MIAENLTPEEEKIRVLQHLQKQMQKGGEEFGNIIIDPENMPESAGQKVALLGITFGSLFHQLIQDPLSNKAANDINNAMLSAHLMLNNRLYSKKPYLGLEAALVPNQEKQNALILEKSVKRAEASVIEGMGGQQDANLKDALAYLKALAKLAIAKQPLNFNTLLEDFRSHPNKPYVLGREFN